jgi:hypothetical protein
VQGRAFYSTSHERTSLVGLSRGPLSWVSLAGLSRGHASVSAPKPVSSVSASEPVSSASAQEPVSPTSVPEPPSSAPAPTPEPRRSKRTLSIPGHYAVLAGRSPAEASQGWKRVDNYSLTTRATWIQL